MKYTILFLSSFLFQSLQAQPGFLDQSFGDKGIKLIYTKGDAHALAIQPDGKILLAGEGTHGMKVGAEIIRLLPDGSIDESFGDKGYVILSAGGVVYDLKIVNDKKILALCNSFGAVVLARYKEDGALDSAFGSNGIARAVFNDFTAVFAMQVQQDGKIVVVGDVTYFDFSHNPVVLRFKQNGSLDEGFGTNGEVILTGLYFPHYAYSVVLQPDGKIIIGGEANANNRFLLARLNTDGSLDASFGTDGVVVSNFPEGEEHIQSIVLQPDGKIVATGPGGLGTFQVLDQVMIAARYNNDGKLDSSFGVNGELSVRFSDTTRAESTKLLLQPDEKIVLVGRISNQFQSYSAAALVRLEVDGSFDSAFGINGKQITEMGGSGSLEAAAALQEDGKIVICGTTIFLTESGSQYYYNVARYNNDIALPLHITYFNASPTNNGGIALNWQTAQENNNNYFAVERSGDSRFSGNTELARVSSNWQLGTGNRQQNYSYTDNAPLQGTNFYSLKQVDKDGKFSYSQIISATMQNGLTVVLYPNPVKDVLNIKGLDATMSYELKIINAKGSVVAKTSINNTSSYKWNFRNLSKGVYYLQAESGKLKAESKTITLKFVKE